MWEKKLKFVAVGVSDPEQRLYMTRSSGLRNERFGKSVINPDIVQQFIELMCDMWVRPLTKTAKYLELLLDGHLASHDTKCLVDSTMCIAECRIESVTYAPGMWARQG